MDLLGDLLNDGDNVNDTEDYQFIGIVFKTPPTVIDDYTKIIFLNMRPTSLRPQRNIENNDKQFYERYQINMIDHKESDERYQIGENKEEILNTNIEVLKL